MKNILITGGSRGLGLEFVKQYLEKGNRVIAASRNIFSSNEISKLKSNYSNYLKIFEVDVGDKESIKEFYSQVSSEISHLDILINNAGVIAGDEKNNIPLGELFNENFGKVYSINTIGPLLMVEAFLSLLKKEPNSKVINISSTSGSISKRNKGGGYAYSSSKSALNMVTKNLSFDLNKYEISIISLHPGWVQTTMSSTENAPLKPEEVVNKMIKLIEKISLKDSGKFLNWRGEELPW